MEMSVKVTYFLKFLVVVVAGRSAAINLDGDLRQLAEMLPGIYSNNGRHSNNINRKVERALGSIETAASAITSLPIKAVYRPVEVTFLPDSFNVYVEHVEHGKTDPHRRWLYSYSKDDSTRSIKLRVYNFNDDSIIEKVSKNPRAIKYLNENDVTTRSSCDMFWRRLGETFVGTTSRECQAVVDGSQMRISVMNTLTKSSLQIDEGWYKASDGSKVLELDGPIFLTKIDEILDNPFLGTDQHKQDENLKSVNLSEKPLLQKDSQTKYNNKDKQNEKITRRNPPYASRNKIETTEQVYGYPERAFPTKTESMYSKAIVKAGFEYNNEIEPSKYNHDKGKTAKQSNQDEIKPMWNLQTYEGIVDALTSGHKVYFTAKTKHCTQTKGKSSDKTVIGDYLNIFEIHRDYSHKQPNKYIQFSLRRTEHDPRKGFFDVVKDITTHRNGTVLIRTAYLDEDKKVYRYFSQECQLFISDTKKGDVKFFIDPYRDVSEVNRNKPLLASLQAGNMFRVSTELDKCRGGQGDQVVIGGEIRDYDMGGTGRH
ncbi:uncharacterized protein LOC127844898 isoform X2 [Dreissena polymorpha]|uniref:uncharacterized protein LOC127844898 isoform X2 n=1 Tax=Dreissena polymorpha TaxID=45954 RepID=UPI002265397F|nr:uncharacterized protein LOC127844898 isoform X2 [Dreissena polymorpha]